VTTDADDGTVLSSTADVQLGQRIRTRLSRGSLVSRIETFDREPLAPEATSSDN